jgi:hypothetical protein
MPINLLDATAPAESAPDPASGPINLLDATAPSGSGAPAAAPPVVIPDTDVDHPDTIACYPDGTPILDHTGNPMQKPPFADLGLAIQRGQGIQNQSLPDQIETLKGWLRQGGPMDYQRIPGHAPNPDYQDFSNYGFGAVTSAAQVSPVVSTIGGIGYNIIDGRWRPGILGTPWENLQNWFKGRSDYLNDRLSFPGVQPSGPPRTYAPPQPDDIVQWPIPPS